MITADTIASMRAISKQFHTENASIAFVPTMGNLHAGHLALVEYARARCDKVVVSIFVNLLQFAPHEDFASYPRTLTADLDKLQDLQVDVVFTPSTQQLYPHGLAEHSLVSVPHLNKLHCGLSRPQFFDGVSTVVTKLMNIVQADIAVFGEKDYQQLCCIKKMVADLCLSTTVHSVPTVRAADGLALSSRNAYLNNSERRLAAKFPQVLQQLTTEIRAGRTDYLVLQQLASKQLAAAGFTTDYIHICESENLLPATAATKHFAILAAVLLGKTRLIDNSVFALSRAETHAIPA